MIRGVDPASPSQLWNIGYQGRSLEGLCELLRAHGVELLVDVRERAWSQRPEFRKQALAVGLGRHDVAYTHCKVAGNPFRPRAGVEPDRTACRAKYTRYLIETPSVVDALESALHGARAALFCYEARRDDCHRGVLLDALQKRGRSFTIVDL